MPIGSSFFSLGSSELEVRNVFSKALLVVCLPKSKSHGVYGVVDCVGVEEVGVVEEGEEEDEVEDCESVEEDEEVDEEDVEEGAGEGFEAFQEFATVLLISSGVRCFAQESFAP